MSRESLETPYSGIDGLFQNSGWDRVGSTWRDRYAGVPAAARHLYMVEIIDGVVPANYPLVVGHMCSGRWSRRSSGSRSP